MISESSPLWNLTQLPEAEKPTVKSLTRAESLLEKLRILLFDHQMPEVRAHKCRVVFSWRQEMIPASELEVVIDEHGFDWSMSLVDGRTKNKREQSPDRMVSVTAFYIFHSEHANA